MDNDMVDESQEELLTQLSRREGEWIDWGRACQRLQASGMNTQAIFETTGWEPAQQNQVVVAAQVYEGLVKAGVAADLLSFFAAQGSDILYELRILTQAERPLAAELACEKQLNRDDAHEMVRAVKEFSRLRTLPEGFTAHPGDAIAYQASQAAKQSTDLQERSRLIARALRFVYSPTARPKIESLLTDFNVTPRIPAPRLPVYRVEPEDPFPRVVPVVGRLPLTPADWLMVPSYEAIGAFHLVKFSGEGAWVALPGWSVVVSAKDPVALLGDSEQLTALREGLPVPQPMGSREDLLVVVDRSNCLWRQDSYFLVEEGGALQVVWFAQEPEMPLLGRVLLVIRPPLVKSREKDDDEPWLLEE